MKKKLISSVLLLAMVSSTITGCSISSVVNKAKDVIKPKEEAPRDYSAKIKGETSQNVVKESELETGNYYVLHDDKYYKITSYTNYFNDGETLVGASGPSLNYHTFYDLTQEDEIPTLYMDNDDKLVYYSEDTLLDYVQLSRFKDDGYTIASYNYQIQSSGRPYLDVETSGLDKTVVIDSDLYKQLSNEKVQYNLLLDKINKTKVTSDYVEDGIISGLEPNKSYNLQLYEGTIYHNIKTTAEIHAFTNIEMFKIAEYSPLKVKNLYEIEIPKYLKTGYYYINDIGLIRFIENGKSYVLDDKDSYNDPILEQKEDEYGEIIMPKIYSECESLNEYSSETPGALGYVEPTDTSNNNTDNTSNNNETTDTKPSIGSVDTTYFKLTANDTAGTIYVESDETDGNVMIYTKDKKSYAEYNSEAKRYEITLEDKDIKDNKEFVIATAGFTDKYNLSAPEGWTIDKTTKDKVKEFVNSDSKDTKSSR